MAFGFFLSFFLKFIYFNWRLITLQHCIGFAIHQHESTTDVHMFPILNPLPPPSPYHPSGSSQGTSPKHPVSCIEPGLAIHFIYDLHVSMPFQKSVIYICVSFAVSHTGLSLPSFYIPYICVSILYWCFFLVYFTLYNRLQFHPSH